MTLELIPNCADSFEITAGSIAVVSRCLCASTPRVTSINVAAKITTYLDFMIILSQTGSPRARRQVPENRLHNADSSLDHKTRYSWISECEPLPLGWE